MKRHKRLIYLLAILLTMTEAPSTVLSYEEPVSYNERKCELKEVRNGQEGIRVIIHLDESKKEKKVFYRYTTASAINVQEIDKSKYSEVTVKNRIAEFVLSGINEIDPSLRAYMEELQLIPQNEKLCWYVACIGTEEGDTYKHIYFDISPKSIYRVKLDPNGGEWKEGEQPQEYLGYLGSKIKILIRPVRFGYKWSGWKVKKDQRRVTKNGKYTIAQEDIDHGHEIILSAQWNKATHMEAFPAVIDFGSIMEGYEDIQAQKITIKSIVTARGVLNPPESQWYTIIDFNDKMPLSLDKEGSFSIQPKKGLAPGVYNETIIIEEEEGAQVEIKTKFTVLEKPSYKVTFLNDKTKKETAAAQNKKAGETFLMPQNTYLNEGYFFSGWYDGEKLYQPGSEYNMPDKDIAFTARWDKVKEEDQSEKTPKETEKQDDQKAKSEESIPSQEPIKPKEDPSGESSAIQEEGSSKEDPETKKGSSKEDPETKEESSKEDPETKKEKSSKENADNLKEELNPQEASGIEQEQGNQGSEEEKQNKKNQKEKADNAVSKKSEPASSSSTYKRTVKSQQRASRLMENGQFIVKSNDISSWKAIEKAVKAGCDAFRVDMNGEEVVPESIIQLLLDHQCQADFIFNDKLKIRLHPEQPIDEAAQTSCHIEAKKLIDVEGEEQMQLYLQLPRADLVIITMAQPEIVQKKYAVLYKGDEQENYRPIEAAGADEAGNVSFNIVEKKGTYKAGFKGNTHIQLAVGSQWSVLNGKKIYLDKAAEIVDQKTMVPLRFVAENLGAEVKWDPHNKRVMIIKGDKKLQMDVGAKGNSAAVLMEDRVMVPLRYVAEVLGADVIWHGETKQIEMIK